MKIIISSYIKIMIIVSMLNVGINLYGPLEVSKPKSETQKAVEALYNPKIEVEHAQELINQELAAGRVQDMLELFHRESDVAKTYNARRYFLEIVSKKPAYLEQLSQSAHWSDFLKNTMQQLAELTKKNGLSKSQKEELANAFKTIVEAATVERSTVEGILYKYDTSNRQAVLSTVTGELIKNLKENTDPDTFDKTLSTLVGYMSTMKAEPAILAEHWKNLITALKDITLPPDAARRFYLDANDMRQSLKEAIEKLKESEHDKELLDKMNEARGLIIAEIPRIVQLDTLQRKGVDPIKRVQEYVQEVIDYAVDTFDPRRPDEKGPVEPFKRLVEQIKTKPDFLKRLFDMQDLVSQFDARLSEQLKKITLERDAEINRLKEKRADYLFTKVSFVIAHSTGVFSLEDILKRAKDIADIDAKIEAVEKDYQSSVKALKLDPKKAMALGKLNKIIEDALKSAEQKPGISKNDLRLMLIQSAKLSPEAFKNTLDVFSNRTDDIKIAELFRSEPADVNNLILVQEALLKTEFPSKKQAIEEMKTEIAQKIISLANMEPQKNPLLTQAQLKAARILIDGGLETIDPKTREKLANIVKNAYRENIPGAGNIFLDLLEKAETLYNNEKARLKESEPSSIELTKPYDNTDFYTQLAKGISVPNFIMRWWIRMTDTKIDLGKWSPEHLFDVDLSKGKNRENAFDLASLLANYHALLRVAETLQDKQTIAVLKEKYEKCLEEIKKRWDGTGAPFFIEMSYKENVNLPEIIDLLESVADKLPQNSVWLTRTQAQGKEKITNAKNWRDGAMEWLVEKVFEKPAVLDDDIRAVFNFLEKRKNSKASLNFEEVNLINHYRERLCDFLLPDQLTKNPQKISARNLELMIFEMLNFKYLNFGMGKDFNSPDYFTALRWMDNLREGWASRKADSRLLKEQLAIFRRFFENGITGPIVRFEEDLSADALGLRAVPTNEFFKQALNAVEKFKEIPGLDRQVLSELDAASKAITDRQVLSKLDAASKAITDRASRI